MSKGRLSGSVAAVLAGLALSGCATTDPANMIPAQLQASVIAEDRLLGAGPGGTPVSVDEMLARARTAKDGGGYSAQTTAEEHAAGTAPQEEGQRQATPKASSPTASAQSPAPPPTGAGDARPPTQAELPPGERKVFFEVTFDGRDEQPPAIAADALAKKVKSGRLSAKTEVTILAGPGPGTTAFEQALLANKRARAVRSLLPEGWVTNQMYDPAFPPDTVRIVLGPRN